MAKLQSRISNPIYTAVCMLGSCANSPPPPLCESFRCGEGWNFADPPLEVGSGPYYWWTEPVWMDKLASRIEGVSIVPSDNFVPFQDVWWVRISVTTHYNSIHMIINWPRVWIGRRDTGETSWKHINVIIMTCTVMPLQELQRRPSVWITCSVWITIVGELANQRCNSTAASLCKKGLLIQLTLTREKVQVKPSEMCSKDISTSQFKAMQCKATVTESHVMLI